ncbi:MAG: hypothetical protein LUD48_05120 [Prevotella sp.]|nr:hypothetical protein [Prevotella sp.]
MVYNEIRVRYSQKGGDPFIQLGSDLRIWVRRLAELNLISDRGGVSFPLIGVRLIEQESRRDPSVIVRRFESQLGVNTAIMMMEAGVRGGVKYEIVDGTANIVTECPYKFRAGDREYGCNLISYVNTVTYKITPWGKYARSPRTIKVDEFGQEHPVPVRGQD